MKTAVINLSAKTPVLPEFPSYGICILESRHARGFTMPPSSYDFAEMMLILDGKGWVVESESRHPVKKGDLVIVPAGKSYYFEDDPTSPLAVLCLCVKPMLALNEIFNSVLPSEFLVVRTPWLAREVATHLRAILYEQSQERTWNASVVVGHTLLLLGKLARRQAPGGDLEERKMRPREVELIARVRDYARQLEETFHGSETIEMVSERLGMSRRSLTEYFRKITGVSRLQYIQRLRLDHACRLLEDSDQSITSVAFACGFEDLSSFFRTFRTRKKMTPAQWREHAKGDKKQP